MSNLLNEMRAELESDFLGVRAHEKAYSEAIEVVSIKPNGVEVRNKYQRVTKGVVIDVYNILKAFDVTDPAIAHATKKLLAAGKRGHKDRKQDLMEAIESIKRAIELEDE